MALGDRFYMREEYHPPEVSIRLIVVLIIAFVLQSILLFYGRFDVSEYLALSQEGLRHGRVWQLITFQFLHSTPWPWHVLFNCLGIYFFGRRVEEALGAKRFTILYLLSGTLGGILQLLLTFLPRHVDAPVVGASAGVCGLIAIFCSLHPMEEIRTWIYFFPISIRAHWFLKFLLGFSAFGALIPFDYVAHGAHLGGILFGIAYVRNRYTWDDVLDRLSFRFPRRRGPSAKPAGRSTWLRNQKSEPMEPGTFISKEVDPILDKISTKGIDSLTAAERKILEAARKSLK